METQTKKRHLGYVNALTVLSAFAVVAMHFNNFWFFGRTASWLAANLIECFCYFAVPMFFMISGITLLDYRERYTTKEYLKKRFVHVGIPFLFWSLVNIFFLQYLSEGHLYWPGLRALTDNVLNNKSNEIFWFFPALFTIYLCIPVLGAIPEDKRKPIFLYGIAAALLLGDILPKLFAGLGLEWNPALSFPVANQGLLYVMLGWVLYKTSFSKKQRLGIYFAGLFALMLHFSGTAILSWQADEIVQTFKSYWGPLCAFWSAAVFVFVRQAMNYCPKPLETFFAKTKPLAFTVYLIQPLIMEFVYLACPFLFSNLVMRILMMVLYFFSSLAAGFVFKKIPVLKHLV